VSDAGGIASTIIDGRYRVLQRVGSGGMADVVCAEDLQLGRRVAIKLLHRRFAEDAEFVERFRREASSAAGLQHPNVVAVYDRGEWDGTYYIAMEYLDGRSLKRVVQEEGPLEATRAIELTIQILRAARFAHKRGIIHRDLKPHNVIVDDEDRAKVTDFGIARAGASDMTETGSIMGTAQYLSPEQAQGLPVSAPSDLYSVGIILYEMLTGRVPFEGESAVTIALKQVSEAPVAPRAHNPAVSPALDAVVLRAVEKDPARRFADADEFIAALEGAAAGVAPAPAPAVAAAATTVLAGDVTRVASLQPTGPMVPIPPPAGVAGSYEVAHAEHSGPPSDVGPPREEGDGRGKWWVALLAGLLVVAALLAGIFVIGNNKVRVPSVVGSPQPEAQLVLRQKGLSSDVVLRENPDRLKGTVIGQEPAGGSRVSKDSVVTLFVSSGPGTARIPDLTDEGRTAARRKLERLGFDVTERGITSDEVKTNHVVETRPGSGEQLEKGETIILVYSKGPQRIPVPSVAGLSEEDARSALETLGFQVATVKQEDDQHDPGTVLEQDPAPKTPLAKGSKVTLTVAKEPAQVDVPDVTGRTKDYATTLLRRAGFEVQVSPDAQPVGDTTQDGKVQQQDPAGGQAKKGSTVTITVGKYDQSLDPNATGDGGTDTGPGGVTGGDGTTPAPDGTVTTP
jgi:beta-lactam-binding protein with PASTA domain/predicted Ser/Thr protein kinase